MPDKIKVLYTSEWRESIKNFPSKQFLEIDIRPFIRVNKNFDKENFKELIRIITPECLVISSQNALHGLYEISESDKEKMSILTLSEKIANQIEGNFKAIVYSKENNENGLSDMIELYFSNQRLLHLTGNLRQDSLKKLLKSKGITIKNYQVYKTEFIQPELNLMDYKAIVFLSYSGIDSFFSKYHLTNNIPVFTIGIKTTKYLQKHFDGPIITASKTDSKTLIKEIHEYFSND
ncbi:uroporphyrinogen-III synthase [Hyphobacterium sp. CCMP332]|nr:uroporphyrinogen-III synthase [Hyphobacterium sp. CCMP332]